MNPLNKPNHRPLPLQADGSSEAPAPSSSRLRPAVRLSLCASILWCVKTLASAVHGIHTLFYSILRYSILEYFVSILDSDVTITIVTIMCENVGFKRYTDSILLYSVLDFFCQYPGQWCHNTIFLLVVTNTSVIPQFTKHVSIPHQKQTSHSAQSPSLKNTVEMLTHTQNLYVFQVFQDTGYNTIRTLSYKYNTGLWPSNRKQSRTTKYSFWSGGTVWNVPLL